MRGELLKLRKELKCKTTSSTAMMNWISSHFTSAVVPVVSSYLQGLSFAFEVIETAFKLY